MTNQNQRDHDLDPYSSPRAFYGSELRLAREKSSLSQDRLGERVFCSGTYIGQFEAGTRRPQPDVSRLLDEVLGTGQQFQRLCRLANKSKFAEYFAKAAELEQQATTINNYGHTLVPGLLQTRAYAESLVRAAQPFEADHAVEGLVQSRLDRQAFLDSPTAPELWVFLHESALRVPVGGYAVAAEQLNHLVEKAHHSRRILLQVLPFEAGAATFLNATTVSMTFGDAPPIAYTESAYAGQLIEEPAMVVRYRRAYDLVRAASLSPECSLDLIASAAKDFVER